MSVPGSSNGDAFTFHPASYLLGLARLGSGKVQPNLEKEGYGGDCELMELNPINSSGRFAAISTDKRSVKYSNVDRHIYDVGVVQANKPAPNCWLYYFEMRVTNAGTKGNMAIGFSSEDFNMTSQIGLEADSCAYYGNDGHLYQSHRERPPFSCSNLCRPFTTNDTVGAGINFCSNEFFFTKNGSFIGAVTKEIQCPLFPTVSVHSQNEEIEVNFGEKQFSFDIKDYERRERMEQHNSQLRDLDNTLIPENAKYGLVRSYLQHYGYDETLNSFELDSKSTFPLLSMSKEDVYDAQNVLYASEQRSELRQLIKAGKTGDAISKLREWFPQILEDKTSVACFLVHCQQFIEFVRVGNPAEAAKYGRKEMEKFVGSAEYDDLVKDCVALLAYEKPMESPAGYLLKDWQRIVVADTVNVTILLTNPKGGKYLNQCLRLYMERLLRQMMDLCYLDKRYCNQASEQVTP
ncbi:Ran-binding protein M homolog [Linum grandiflorum]